MPGFCFTALHHIPDKTVPPFVAQISHIRGVTDDVNSLEWAEHLKAGHIPHLRVTIEHGLGANGLGALCARARDHPSQAVRLLTLCKERGTCF